MGDRKTQRRDTECSVYEEDITRFALVPQATWTKSSRDQRFLKTMIWNPLDDKS